MMCCWEQGPRLRPDMWEVLGTLRASSVSLLSQRPGTHFSSDRPSVLASSQTPLSPTDPEALKHPESSKLPPSSEDREPNLGTETSPPTNQGESTGQYEGGSTQSSGSSQAATPDPAGSENNSRSSDSGDEQWGRSSGRGLVKNNASTEGVGGPRNDDTDSPVPFSVLPQAPANCFSREEIANEIMDLTDQLASVALFGSIGVGKSSVALTLLHHDRTQAKFDRNRYFMRCDDLEGLLEGFLERLSDAIHADRTTDVAQLRSHLESSAPLMLLLDGADVILDPLTPEAKEISATIEEFGSYAHVCLITTSRMYPDIHGFHRVEIPTLSEDGARDTFYSLCNLGRSPAVDDLIAGLDFHPLSINLLASFVRENDWDESTLLRTWDNDQTSLPKTSYYRRLDDTVESSFCSPTIKGLGTVAQDALEAIATSPCGVEESTLDSTFSEIAGIGRVVAVFFKFSLLYRDDNFVKVPSPIRFYFMKSTGSDTAHDQPTDGDTPSFPCYPSIAGPFISLYPFAVLV